MAAQDLVLVDTCIWIQFFNRPQSREKHAVDELLDEDRVALIGPILAEVLQGFPKKLKPTGLLQSYEALAIWKSLGTTGVPPHSSEANSHRADTSFPSAIWQSAPLPSNSITPITPPIPTSI